MRNLFTHFCFINLCWCAALVYCFATGIVSRPTPSPQNDFDAMYETVSKPVHISKR